MDTNMSGITAPSHHKTGAASHAKAENQSLSARVLGGAASPDGGRHGGANGRHHGESRSHGGLGRGRGRGHHGDETELSKKIAATHHHEPANERGVAVKPILNVIDVILHRALHDIPGVMQGTSLTHSDEKALHTAALFEDMVEIPTRMVGLISCEINCKCTSGVDVHTIVMEILQIVKHYSWDSKAALALVSFAQIFGEFRLEVQLISTNPLAKALAYLKQLPDVLQHAVALKPQLDALFDLVNEILDVTKTIAEFYDLPHHDYFTAESPEILAALSHIPTAVYWTIRSIVVSSTQILALTGMGIEYLTEPWELSSLAHKLKNIKAHLVDIINSCNTFIKRRKDDEAFEALVRIFINIHIDNHKPLSSLFHYADGQPPLFDCSTKRRVSTEDLRRKIVALFITDVDTDLMRGSEFAILQQMYMEKRHSATRTESQYEVVWVPITDTWSEDKHRLFETLRDQMEWQSVHHPSVVSPVVMRFFREKWNFAKKPMLVVMDTQGKIVHHNAIHMMCIWGSLAYPFTAVREKLLWEQLTWSIDLIIDNLEPNIGNWMQEGKHICLYGGEDVEWIRRFTRIAKDVARESGITLELLYVGKSKAKERTMKNVIDIILREGLSRTLDWNLIWYFWMRLESMWHSKGQLITPESIKADAVMQGIIAMLSYGSGDQGWALFSRGVNEMAKGSGEHVVTGLAEHGRWAPRALEIGFVRALDEYLRQSEAPHHCTRLILPATGTMPETVSCSECGRLMERFTMFRCCLD